MSKIERIKELNQLLNEYRDSYYNDSVSIVTDREYDDLFDELKKLEEETNIIMTNSPTQTVGYEVKSKLEKIKHSHPMLSLDKTKSVKDLKKFAKDEDCLLMCKMDGLTILLTYENGVLTQAETRGNGEEGEIITHNAKVFENIPLHIDFSGHLEIEGEAIITYGDFEKINKKLPVDKKYANPRNLASGSVRQLDSRVTAERHIRFIVWKMPGEKESMLTGFQDAEALGFEVVPYIYIEGIEKDYDKHIIKLRNLADKKGFPIDGLVVSYNDIAYGKSLGMTGHHPKHSLAFKFYDDIYPTKLIDVEFTMGKTGVLTPTAIFKPVEIDGSIVERASLHNLSIIKKLGITHKEQTVNVYKSNMIIPQIDSVEKDDIEVTNENIIIPVKVCPICGAGTEVVKDNDTEVLICSNPNCKGKLLGKLSNFVSKNAINIDGLSEQTLQKFINLEWIESFQDIYHLSVYKNKMYCLEGFGKKSSDKLLENIEKSRNTTLDRFLYGLCIPLIGRSASKAISKCCDHSIDTFMSIMGKYGGKYFWSIDGFGPSMRQSLNDWWNENCLEVLDLSKEFTFKTEDKKSSHIDLSGKVFVITGNLNHYVNRDELVSEIESLGGKVSGSVSKKTSYLINNDISSQSGKNKKAINLGIPIISENDFVKMIEGEK